MTIKAEVGDLEQFDSSDGLASYAGLAPAVRKSGERKAHIRGMSKQGDPRLQHMLTEAVHIHVMFGDSRIAEHYRRKKEQKGSKKAAVAAAKKLLEVMYLTIVRKQVFHAH